MLKSFGLRPSSMISPFKAFSRVPSVRLTHELAFLFDNPQPTSYFKRSTGLFTYPDLKTPQDLITASERTITRASLLLDTVVHRPRRPGWSDERHMQLTVKRLDRLSDLVCVVVDLAELIRNVHPQKTLKQADALYASKWDKDESTVAKLLLIEFENSGIHLHQTKRDEFINLNNKILISGQEFMINGHASTSSHISLSNPSSSLIGLNPRIFKQLTASNGKAHIPINSNTAHLIVKQCRNEDTRRLVYTAIHAGSDDRVGLLEEMLLDRQRVAELVGFKSYGHLWLRGKMIETPENAMMFLTNQEDKVMPFARQELENLTALKRQYTNQSAQFNAWDRAFYAQLLPPPTDYPTEVSLLTVGQTIEALSWVFTKLFGISLEPASVMNGELYHPDVRKLNVVQESLGIIGIVYCDLYERPEHKFNGAAHFTIKCSRCLDFDAEDDFLHSDRNVFRNEEHVFLRDGVKYQLPVVVLNTLFAKSGRPTLLSQHEVETVFHEMGHAMHSMLAKTRFQHISGTRVAMDSVEVPSTLMEHFSSPRVLQQFKNEVYNESIPLSQIQSHLPLGDALDAMHQIQMAQLDQLYHSEPAFAGRVFDTTRILKTLVNDARLMKHVDGVKWQCNFTHLFTYGASYYSYAWSRLIADRIWSGMFKDQDMNDPHGWRKGGELLQHEYLGRGGGRDPWVCLDKMGMLKEGEKESKLLIID